MKLEGEEIRMTKFAEVWINEDRIRVFSVTTENIVDSHYIQIAYGSLESLACDSLLRNETETLNRVLARFNTAPSYYREFLGGDEDVKKALLKFRKSANVADFHRVDIKEPVALTVS